MDLAMTLFFPFWSLPNCRGGGEGQGGVSALFPRPPAQSCPGSVTVSRHRNTCLLGERF